MTASLLGQKKWFLITIQGGEVGVGGELAQPLVGKEPGFFHASLPNLSIFEKRYIYSYKYNIWEFGVCHLLSWLFVYSGLGVQLLCSEKGLLNFYIRTQTKSTCPQQTYIHNIHNEIKP